MPVQKDLIKPQIKILLEQAKEKDDENGVDFFAEELSKIIVNAIKSGNVLPGQTIAGSSPSGPVTGTTTSKGTIQ